MIALGGPKLKPNTLRRRGGQSPVSMIALGGPKLKLYDLVPDGAANQFQ